MGAARPASETVRVVTAIANPAPKPKPKPKYEPGSVEDLQARNETMRTKLEIAELRAENAELKLNTLKRKYEELEKRVLLLKQPAVGGVGSVNVAPPDMSIASGKK